MSCSTKISDCTDPYCFTLINPYTSKLYPHKVNEISISYAFMFNICNLIMEDNLNKYVLIVKRHNNQPWQILTDVIFLSSLHDGNFIVPIITDKEMELTEDVHIDHFTCMSIKDYLTLKKGNNSYLS